MDVEMAYIAGFFDGDGSLSINPRTDSHGYRAQFSIDTKDKPLLYWINDVFGGTGKISLKKQERTKVYQWKLSDHMGKSDFFGEIIPFLKIRKHQAELFREFCDSRLDRESNWSGWTEREIEIAEIFYKHRDVSLKVEDLTDPLVVAYMAGLFDAEGYITAVRRSDNKKSVQTKIGIDMTNLPLLNWVHKTFGFGNVYSRKKSHSPKHKLVHSWYIYNCQDIERMLRPMLLFLRSKKKQALMLLDFCVNRKEKYPHGSIEREMFVMALAREKGMASRMKDI